MRFAVKKKLEAKNQSNAEGETPSYSPITDPPEGGRKIPPKVKNELVWWMSGFDFEVKKNNFKGFRV